MSLLAMRQKGFCICIFEKTLEKKRKKNRNTINELIRVHATERRRRERGK